MSAESLTADLGHQLAQATALRNLAYVVVVAEHRGQFTRAHNLASALFYRSLQTHEAIEILIKSELTEDARVLVRVLVEQAVNCAYMLTVADDQIVEDFVQYPKYMRYELLRDLRSVDEIRLRRSIPIEFEKEVQVEYESLHPRFKGRRTGQWCADGPLHKRAAKVDEKLSELFKKPHREFLWLVNSEWRLAGSHVHGMADSLLDQVSQGAEGGITIEQKFDPEDAATALYTANFALGLVLPLVDNSLGEKYASDISMRMGKFTGHD
jgi:hypothetical protein